MSRNPHFDTVTTWKSAQTMLTFRPRKPRYTAGCPLQSLQIHIRDHKLRELAITDRTLEAHYGAFVVSQARKEIKEAKRLALSAHYGISGADDKVAGNSARIYELGPEPSPMDIDGRSPTVVTWHDGEMFYLIASDRLASVELLRIARSLYG